MHPPPRDIWPYDDDVCQSRSCEVHTTSNYDAMRKLLLIIILCRRLEAMQAECTSALRTQRMPTTRNEEYRFTDVGPLLQVQPQASTLSSHVSALP